jgi:hypothetical protein
MKKPAPTTEVGWSIYLSRACSIYLSAIGPVSLYAYYTDGRVGGVVPSAHVQAHGGDTNILVKLILTNSTAAAIPGVNGPVPTNGPPPAPPQPQCGHEISSHPCQSLGERGILASRGRRLAGHFFRIE